MKKASKDQFDLGFTMKLADINNRNNTPWAIPITSTNIGLSNRYLYGIATNSNAKSEIPSNNAVILNQDSWYLKFMTAIL